MHNILALCFLFLRWAPAGEAVCKCPWDQTSFWRPTTCGWWYLHGSRPFSQISSVLPYRVDALINLLGFVWTYWWICRMFMNWHEFIYRTLCNVSGSFSPVTPVSGSNSSVVMSVCRHTTCLCEYRRASVELSVEVPPSLLLSVSASVNVNVRLTGTFSHRCHTFI